MSRKARVRQFLWCQMPGRRRRRRHPLPKPDKSPRNQAWHSKVLLTPGTNPRRIRYPTKASPSHTRLQSSSSIPELPIQSRRDSAVNAKPPMTAADISNGRCAGAPMVAAVRGSASKARGGTTELCEITC